MMANSAKTGYLCVTGAAILWAVAGVGSKYLFNGGMSPFELVQLRLTLSVIIVFAGMKVFAPSKLRISPRDIFYFAIVGIVGVAAVQSSYYYAISKINVAAAILLQYLAPVFITAYTAIFLREKIRPSTLGALAGTIGGCYLLVGGYNLDLLSMNTAGILGGVFSAITFAFFTCQGQYGMRKYSPQTFLAYSFLFGAIAWNILHPPLSAFTRNNTGVEWFWIGFITLPGTVFAFMLYLEGIKRIRAVKAGITATLEPIAAAVISLAFLHETMELPQVAGGMVVIISVIALQCARGERNESSQSPSDRQTCPPTGTPARRRRSLSDACPDRSP